MMSNARSSIPCSLYFLEPDRSRSTDSTITMLTRANDDHDEVASGPKNGAIYLRFRAALSVGPKRRTPAAAARKRYQVTTDPLTEQ
ncbi:hypothetical protein ZHAS_00003087 [Anopheles sinensis]|uniref:Uncharacterized protein n=1 Tax=Anopheles sinensis TaxID=74873 RepID=A0A084VDL4_ANOSI|nr:hypothetical protein ZHAS_00003087 [Anopheles sinensis]